MGWSSCAVRARFLFRMPPPPPGEGSCRSGALLLRGPPSGDACGDKYPRALFFAGAGAHCSGRFLSSPTSSSLSIPDSPAPRCASAADELPAPAFSFACAQKSRAASAARSLRAAAAAALAASVQPLPLEGRRADEALCGLEGGAPPLVGVDISSWVLRPLALIVG